MSFHMENRSKAPEGKGRAAGGRCHRPGEMKESWPKRRSKEVGGLQTAQSSHTKAASCQPNALKSFPLGWHCPVILYCQLLISPTFVLNLPYSLDDLICDVTENTVQFFELSSVCEHELGICPLQAPLAQFNSTLALLTGLHSKLH
ncbi:Denn Domain-Containing Protein 4B [Manis pentadactyla]|nr:Denn Domain-Containing Protein 4B [Manis pentadactyla]